MATLKDVYDPEVIESIIGSKVEEQASKPEETSVYDTIAQPHLEFDEYSVLFSELFWKPKSIPDIPVPQFSDDDWDANAQIHIPKVDSNWVWNKDVTERFMLALYEGDTTLLYGLAGTGKSCLPEQVCALLRVPFWRMSCNKETREGHFLGTPGIEYDEDAKPHIKQEPTMLTDSLRYGGIFCEDEAFRHSSALVLQSLREKTNRCLTLPDAPGRTASERRLFAPEGRWWYVMTDNTVGTGDDTGLFDAEVQDASTLDRIDCAIEVPYMSKPDERKILDNHCTLHPDIINGMLDLAKAVRTSFAKQTILNTMSIRPLLAWARKTELTGSLEEGFKLSWYNKLCKDDQAVIKDMYHQIFSRKL